MVRGATSAGVTRAETVAAALRETILSGGFVSGERLVEIKIAQAHDVSQNTVRDALRILEQEGWVVKNPRRGVYVRTLNTADATELCALIASVETLALTWALEQPDKALRAELRGLLTAASKAASAGQQQEAFKRLIGFHMRIGIASKPLTAEVLETLYNQIRLLEALRQARAPRSAHELQRLIDSHEAIMEAIDVGDADAACQSLREQIGAYHTAIVAAMRL